MRWGKTILLISAIIISNFLLTSTHIVKADNGYAQVWIICLSDVTCWNFGDQESHASKIQVKNGAIAALEFKERYSLPMAHPKLGKTPPYYGISYYIVTEWSTYKRVIELYNDVVVINTHGEILPIPSGYDPVGWMNKIADAMLKRRVTWVHTGGYPFYRVWHQGANQSIEWPSSGTYGFKNFTQYINLNNVTCHPPGSETESVDLNEHAEYTLIHGWYRVTFAHKVERGRPLKASDFKNYTILTIWGTEDAHMTGAVIAFVKPSERALPADRRGFGAYVHIGTRKTFHVDGEETDGDYYRGYVGAAAAIWTETMAFKSFTAAKECTYTGGGYAGWGLTATPVITHYTYDGTTQLYKVTMVFGIYGCLTTNIGKYIDWVRFYLGYLPDGCTVVMKSSISKNGYKYGNPNIIVDTLEDVKLIAKPWLFFLGAAATGRLEFLVWGIDGFMLFSDYVKLDPSKISGENGVDEEQPPNDYIKFDYRPESFYEQPGDGYTYWEFQSLIYIELTVNMTNRKQWTVVPMQWLIIMDDYNRVPALQLSGDCSIALYKAFDKSAYKATVFFDDFSGNMNDWSIWDANPSAGQDYWGKMPAGWMVWCAAFGNNSIYGRPNLETVPPRYDKCMDASMAMDVDLRPYRSPVTLRYFLSYFLSTGDYLSIEYYSNGAWVASETLTGTKTDYWEETPIPTIAEKIRFRFYSNHDNYTDAGVYIHHIEIVAIMPNDANTNADAGDDFASATYIAHPNSYGAYLNYDKDWYRFDITAQNIAEGKMIYISIQKPQYTIFQMELYDGNNQIKSNSSNTITYHLKTSDTAGQWRLRIYPIIGFGPYSFRIELLTQAPGGCPVLLVWNGSKYVDYGIINIHNAEGYDVIKEVSISSSDVKIEGKAAKLRLKEGWEGLKFSHSLIDQVELYAVDNFGNRYLCPLIKAVHNEQGNILLKLLFSDDQKADIYLMQTIDLQFIVPYPKEIIQSFIFIIEGHNQEKIDY